LNSKERIFAALNLQIPDRVPVFENSIAPNVIEAILGKNDLFKLIEFMDLDGVAVTINYKKQVKSNNEYLDEFGILRRFGETYDMPLNNPINDLYDLKKYKWPDYKVNIKYINIEKAKSYFKDKKAIIILLRDVLSYPRDLLGFENFLISFHTNKKLIEELIKYSVEYNLKIAEKAFKAGAEIVLATDDYADNMGPFINPVILKELVFPELKKLFLQYKKIGFKVIKHSDGNIMPIIEDFMETGIDCLDPIDPLAGMDLQLIKMKFGNKICLKGNINCATTLVSGRVIDVHNEVKYCVKNAAKNGGFILSSSNSIHSGVKPINFLEMIKANKKYGIYKR
jgi:uroporphyrinogen decarboxylase